MKGSSIRRNENQDVSIIIVNWNTKDLLRECLRSILDTGSRISLLIYVVDNNSLDGSVEMVKEEFKQVILIENERNEGFSRANNKAIMRAKSRYVLLLNSDTVVLDKSIEKMLEFLDQNVEIGVLGCKLVNKYGILERSAALFPSIASAIFGGEIIPNALGRLLRIERFPGLVLLPVKDPNKIVRVDWVVGACMLVRLEAINDVGLLDSNLSFYGEEIDWCFRIKKAGWQIVYFPEATIIHHRGGSTNFSYKISVYKKVYATRYFYHKHNNYLSSLIYDFIIFFTSILKTPVWGILLLVLHGNETVKTKFCYQWATIKNILLNKPDP